MSTSLHQYPSAAFSHLPAPNMVDHQQQQQQHHHHLAAQHMGPSPLDALAHTSQYAALQYHQDRHVLPNGKALVKPHRLPFASGPLAPRNQRDLLHERSGRSSATSGPVRRRISRACDQCNQLRTKCDGRQRFVTPGAFRDLTAHADLRQLRALHRYVATGLGDSMAHRSFPNLGPMGKIGLVASFTTRATLHDSKLTLQQNLA
jgi:hypothetical protein